MIHQLAPERADAFSFPEWPPSLAAAEGLGRPVRRRRRRRRGTNGRSPVGTQAIPDTRVIVETAIVRATAMPERAFGVPRFDEVPPGALWTLRGPTFGSASGPTTLQPAYGLGALGARRKKKKRRGLFGFLYELTPGGTVKRHLRIMGVGKKRKRKPKPAMPSEEEMPGAPVPEPEPEPMPARGVTEPELYAPAPAAPPSPGPPAPGPAGGMVPGEVYEPEELEYVTATPPPEEEALILQEEQTVWPGGPEEEIAEELYVQRPLRQRYQPAALAPAPAEELVTVYEEAEPTDLLGQGREIQWWWQPTEPTHAEISGLGQGAQVERYFIRPVQEIATAFAPVVTSLARPRGGRAAAADDVYRVPEDTTPAWLWPAVGIGGAALVVAYLMWPRRRVARRRVR